MDKIRLVKKLVMKDIQNRKPLVRMACENEMEAYKAYLEQLKEEYMALPVDQLEGMVRGAERKAA